jgi:hypothetical protein
MAGIWVGLLLGAGLFCIWWSWWPDRGPTARTGRGLSHVLADELAEGRQRVLVAPQVKTGNPDKPALAGKDVRLKFNLEQNFATISPEVEAHHYRLAHYFRSWHGRGA